MHRQEARPFLSGGDYSHFLTFIGFQAFEPLTYLTWLDKPLAPIAGPM